MRGGWGGSGALNAEGGARVEPEGFLARSAPPTVVPGDDPTGVECRGVGGTDKVGRPLPKSMRFEFAGLAAPGMGIEVKGPSSRGGGGGMLLCVGTEPAGEGLGVGTDAVDEVDGADDGAGGTGPLFLIRSAAIRTLVGTRFNLMAPPTDDVDVEEDSSLDRDLGALKGEGSVSFAHGDGKGFNGEIIEAEVDKDGM